MPDTLPLLEAPDAIPGYRIEQALERRPGSWTVYQATDAASYEPVALTIMGAQLNHDRAYGERLLHDMELLAELEHPSLVPVLDAGRAERGLYVVSELPDVIALEATLALRLLAPEELVALFDPVADLLDRAHAEGLLHRGLSPATVVMPSQGRLRLTAFGLADAVAAARGPDRVLLAHMAPEQVADLRLSPRTDVYGLAATMSSCLTGVEGGAAAARSGGRERRPHVPREVRRVLGRAMAEAPARRPASARALMEELQAAISGREVERGAGTPGHVARPAPAPAGVLGRRRLAALGVAALLAAGAGTALASLGGEEAPPPPPAPAPEPVPATTDQLSLTAGSAGWSLVEDTAEVPGLPLADPVALAGRGAGNGMLTAGLVAEVDARLLPAELDAELASAPVAEPVRLGRYEGFRYAGLELEASGRALDLYVVPTSAGAATIACQADAGSEADFMRRCEAVAATLVLEGVTAEPLGPSPEYAAALAGTVRRLDAARRTRRAALASATTPTQQANRASALAREYANATARLDAAEPDLGSRGFDAALVGGLRAVRDAYRALAAAARAQNRPAYAAQRTAVIERERRLGALLERFGRA